MKAAVYYENGPPDVFRYEDVPGPALSAGCVRVQVEAISIEGGDVLNRAGGPLLGRPHVVGYQCAGTVVEVGEGVTDRSVGERVVAVMFSGSHAEQVVVPTVMTLLVPDGLAIEEAACVPIPFGTADDCLFEFGRLVGGETVLVQAGASGVGIAAIQLAKLAGATVLATASSDSKLSRLGELGLDHGINYASGDFVAEARRLTEGRGVDLVVDSVGGRTLQRSIECLAPRGRCVTVGNAGRDAETRIDPGPLMLGNRSLTGVFLGAEMASGRVQEMIDGHVQAVARGDLRVVIDRTYPLADAAAAHAYIESRQAVGRVVLVP